MKLTLALLATAIVAFVCWEEIESRRSLRLFFADRERVRLGPWA